MSTLSKAQKESIMAEFRSLTNAIPADASRICKKAGYRLNMAYELFYNDHLAQSNAERSFQSRSKALTEGLEVLLNSQFDQFKDPDDPSRMDMEGLMRYLSLLSLTPEDPKVLCLCQLLKSPRLGILERKEFVQNWSSIFLNRYHQTQQQQPNSSSSSSSSSSVTINSNSNNVNRTTIQNQKELVEFEIECVKELDRKLRCEPDYFQQVYRFTFDFGRDEGQKSLALETAIAFWELILPLTPKLDPKIFKEDYLGWWFELIRQRNKAITRDTWNLFLDFILQLEDRFENYDESAAWPSLIDEYVLVAKKKIDDNDKMEVC